MVLIFFIAGLLYLLRFEHVDNLGAYSIPSETGLLIPSDFVNCAWRRWRLVVAKGRVYCDIVKFRWPLVIACSALFTVFFHYEIRYTNSIWVEFIGGLIIWV